LALSILYKSSPHIQGDVRYADHLNLSASLQTGQLAENISIVNTMAFR
jgi:hypothetical protein